jgi:hypothetical protein
LEFFAAAFCMTQKPPANLIYAFVILQTLEIFCGSFLHDTKTSCEFDLRFCNLTNAWNFLRQLSA